MTAEPAPILILASRSPRRAWLLRHAGYHFTQINPPYEDPPQPENGTHQVMAGTLAQQLALAKARSVLSILQPSPDTSIVLGCDTICVATDGRLLGQPATRDQARAMIQSFVDTNHNVVTGVALLEIQRGQVKRELTFHDTAVVRFGSLADDRLEQYLNTDQWQGKAGGYNLFDRQRAGWDIVVIGDPATVVGLPMSKLTERLRLWSVEANMVHTIRPDEVDHGL